MSKITWDTDCNAPCCAGRIVAEDGRDILVQTDWDWPSVASTFGWSVADVQNAKREGEFDWKAECGVFKCPECSSAWYPMELEQGLCPDCDCAAERFTPCEHEATDGTVPCKACGLKPGDFIAAAGDYLDDNDGATADDPGYFQEA